MNEETYRIKPLKWKARRRNSIEGPTEYARSLNYEFVVLEPNGPSRRCFLNGTPYLNAETCKRAAEAMYRERLLSALEPVPCKETT